MGRWTTLALAGALFACDGIVDLDELQDRIDQHAEAQYPIVLAHGFFGFEQFAGLEFITYYYGVKDALSEAGEKRVFTPAVDPFNNSEVRGAQLLEAVEAALEQTGAEKVNLIAHSQGGLDARYVASLRPDLVASVTTVSTPHRGTALTDYVLGLNDRPILASVIDGFVNLIGAPLYDQVGAETSVVAAILQMTTTGASSFSETYPDSPGVHYYSIAGRTDRNPGGEACQAEGRPAFITRYDDARDPVGLSFLFSEAIIDGPFFGQIPNDGLITVESARWGRFLGCIPADHLDQIGHLFGDLPGLFNPFRHREFYVDLVGWLRLQGH